MARSETHTDLSASIVAGSGEMFDIFCQPCGSDQHLEATGYCQECSQYLCLNCTDVHSKLAATLHHTVIDKSEMPKTKVQPKIQSTDILSEKCVKHAGKVLDYFCKTHNEICCSVCVTLDHDSCKDRNYVPDISSGIASSQEHRNLRADLDQLVLLTKQRQEQLNDDSKNNEKYYAKTLADIKESRKQLNEILDKIEEDTKQEVSKIHQENASRIKSASAKCNTLLSEVKAMTVNMDTVSKTGKNNQLFVQGKTVRHRKAEIEQQLCARNTITKYALAQDETIQQIMSTLSTIGTLPVKKEETPTRARYIRQIDTNADREECAINGIAVLAADRVVITGLTNKSVKLYDTKVDKLISRLDVSSEPWGITVMKPNQVAVALAYEQKIDIITVTDKLSMKQTIQTPGAAISGLCYNGSKFITACWNSESVKIINMAGSTLNTFGTDDKGDQLFESPQHIALSRDKDAVYVIDDETNKVTSMSIGGRVNWVYRHDELKRPAGIAVGKDGAVYVCSFDTDTVHQLTPSGELTKIILGTDRGLAAGPYIIAYGDEEDMLYISSGNLNHEDLKYIRMFQLE